MVTLRGLVQRGQLGRPSAKPFKMLLPNKFVDRRRSKSWRASTWRSRTLLQRRIPVTSGTITSTQAWTLPNLPKSSHSILRHRTRMKCLLEVESRVLPALSCRLLRNTRIHQAIHKGKGQPGEVGVSSRRSITSREQLSHRLHEKHTYIIIAKHK